MRAVVTTRPLLADGVAEASQRGLFSGGFSELQRLTPTTPLAIQSLHRGWRRSTSTDERVETVLAV
jgi:hypothetical protein